MFYIAWTKIFVVNLRLKTFVEAFSLGSFRWEPNFRSGTFGWQISFGHFRLGTFAWWLSPKGVCLLSFRLGSFACGILPRDCRLKAFAEKGSRTCVRAPSFRTFRVETVGCFRFKLLLGVSCLGICASEFCAAGCLLLDFWNGYWWMYAVESVLLDLCSWMFGMVATEFVLLIFWNLLLLIFVQPNCMLLDLCCWIVAAELLLLNWCCWIYTAGFYTVGCLLLIVLELLLLNFYCWIYAAEFVLLNLCCWIIATELLLLNFVLLNLMLQNFGIVAAEMVLLNFGNWCRWVFTAAIFEWVLLNCCDWICATGFVILNL